MKLTVRCYVNSTVIMHVILHLARNIFGGLKTNGAILSENCEYFGIMHFYLLSKPSSLMWHLFRGNRVWYDQDRWNETQKMFYLKLHFLKIPLNNVALICNIITRAIINCAHWAKSSSNQYNRLRLRGVVSATPECCHTAHHPCDHAY